MRPLDPAVRPASDACAGARPEDSTRAALGLPSPPAPGQILTPPYPPAQAAIDRASSQLSDKPKELTDDPAISTVIDVLASRHNTTGTRMSHLYRNTSYTSKYQFGAPESERAQMYQQFMRPSMFSNLPIIDCHYTFGSSGFRWYQRYGWGLHVRHGHAWQCVVGCQSQATQRACPRVWWCIVLSVTLWPACVSSIHAVVLVSLWWLMILLLL